MKNLYCAFWITVFACGPSTGVDNETVDARLSNDGGSLVDAYTGPSGSIRGTVWAPGNAPGSVPTDHEIPISDALVWLSVSPPPAIPSQVYCEQCADTPGSSVFSGAKGEFSLTGIRPDDYYLVIQKGQFRIWSRVTVVVNETLDAPTAITTLPSTSDPANGKDIPRIALAVGIYDRLEDVMGKMGIGELDSEGNFIDDSAGSDIDFYENDAGFYHQGPLRGTLTQLLSNYDLMQQYHIIFIACSGVSHDLAIQDEQVLRNIREYVKAGGKLYVTDWSGEFADAVFPEQIEFEASYDTPAEAYDRDSDTWNTSLFGDSNGPSSYASTDAEVIDAKTHSWLDGQVGPATPQDPGGIGYNASSLEMNGMWNTIVDLHSVQVGADDEGFPVFDTPTAYVIGDHFGALPKTPLAVSYQPTGCGRVIYSAYHTTELPHLGLVPQERLLLYLIMQIGECVETVVID